MRRRLTLELALLRAVALGALLLLLVNPAQSRSGGAGEPPLLLLDGSLSMAGANGVWRAALDSARHLAAGGLIWRFGDAVNAFDTTPPSAGRSQLAPALAAAAGRSGPVIVVTDGVISDATDVPADLRRRSRIVVLPRAPFFDAFVASVDGPRRVAVGDTMRLRVNYGTAGRRDGGGGMSGAGASIVVTADGRRLLSRRVPLPDSGVLVTELTLPSSLFSGPGLTALDIRLEGVPDAEPRDDARLFIVEVSPQPTAVVLGSPPGWESRFFTRTLSDVARVPVKLFVETEPDRWRDGATLTPVSVNVVQRAVAGAHLVALIGTAGRLTPFRRHTGVVWWPQDGATAGDWYVDPPPASPLAGSLTGVAWDSLPPATAVAELPVPADAAVLLTARLARRGPPRALALVRDSSGSRLATVMGTGLWRWGFRGGAAAEAYRAFVAAIADWLLAEREGLGHDRFAAVAPETPAGTALGWRWIGRAPVASVPITLASGTTTIAETLRFDADGQVELRLSPGVYRWRAVDGPERGLVAVERYSDEWRPATATIGAQAGEPGGSRREVVARDQWWLYALVLGGLVGEWAWRRRQGLP